MKVKICGITNIEDAFAAIDGGADMLGYNFYPKSKRYLNAAQCAEIQNKVVQSGRSTIGVGVFVNETVQQIENILTNCNLEYAQLSGDENTNSLQTLGARAFKGIRPRTSEEAVALGEQFHNPLTVPALLVDAYHPSEYGGTGTTGDWGAARRLVESYPLLLAGGLSPKNVAIAVEQVQPWGVDVASGVESSPGKKDNGKMRLFIIEAKK